MSRLVRTVHLTDERGRAYVFGPGSQPPEWAAKRITNPAAWDSVPQWSAEEPQVAAVEVKEPPRKGPGSGAKAWAEYARSLGLEVGDEDTREDIQELVDAYRTE